MESPDYKELPLFPLNVVLFPGMYLPLHIFEERYKLMMQHIMDADRRFGVVLIKSGKEAGEPAIPYDVGTIAHVIDVLPQKDGRMNITTVGEKPFRIVEVERLRPYIIGRIETIERENPQSEDLAVAAQRLREHFQTFLALFSELAGVKPANLKLDGDPEALSYVVASAMRTDLKRKQLLLQTNSTEERITAEIRLLEEENLSLKLFLDQKRRAEEGPPTQPPRERFSPN